MPLHNTYLEQRLMTQSFKKIWLEKKFGTTITTIKPQPGYSVDGTSMAIRIGTKDGIGYRGVSRVPSEAMLTFKMAIMPMKTPER